MSPNKYIQFFIDSVGDGIFVVDAKGIIKKANKASGDILGYQDNKKLLGQACLVLLGATDDKGKIINKNNAALFKSIKLGEKVTNAKRQFLKKDGERIWTSITTSPIKKGKKTKGAIIVMRDITKERRQEQYQQDFAHIVSHNLRTPLGNLLWEAEFMLSGKIGALEDKQKEYMKNIYQSLQLMNKMINDTLHLSRLQKNNLKIKMQKIILKNIISETIKDIKFFAEEQKVKIIIKSKKPYYIKGDSEHIRTIIQNIIENAIRYSFKGTKIIIDIEKKGADTVFSCTNEGIGIPKNKAKFIFSKLFRAKNAIEKQEGGTGMGMYISQELARLNKAKIWFESEPNKKTTFYASFKSY